MSSVADNRPQHWTTVRGFFVGEEGTFTGNVRGLTNRQTISGRIIRLLKNAIEVDNLEDEEVMLIRPERADDDEPRQHQPSMGVEQAERTHKRLPVETRARAEARALDTLFQPINGRTATRHERLCTGKYKPAIRGKSVEVPGDVAAVYSVPRSDRHGPYHALYCIVA